MRSRARALFLTMVCGVMLAGLVSPAGASAATPFGIEKFVAVNCEVSYRDCASSHETIPWEALGLGETGEELEETFGPQTFYEPAEPAEPAKEGYVQAGGRVPWGITDFKVNTEGPGIPFDAPAGGPVEKIRTDVAPGLATSPAAVHQCTFASYDGGTEGEPFPGTGFYPAPTEECEEQSEIGENKATVYVPALHIDLGLAGAVYNLEPPTSNEPSKALASDYGVALPLPVAITGAGLKEYFEIVEKLYGSGAVPSPTEQAALEGEQWYAHTLIEGNVEWGKQAEGTGQGDYHDYFKINVSPELPLLSSRLVFNGRSGNGAFITNATACPGHDTTKLKLIDELGTSANAEYTTPLPLSKCNSLKFEPKFELAQGSTASDAPDSLTTTVSLPQEPKALEQSQVKSASFVLPEGMTLNPSAAYGLQACTEEQAHIGSEEFGTNCPDASKVGTVDLEVPTLPAGSLKGSVYLGSGSKTSTTITKPPYTIYVVANSERYGVSVRLKGEVIPKEATGRITTVFDPPLPEQPFTSIALHFDRGVLTSVANPLICGTPEGSASFAPTSSETAAANQAFGATVTGCASPIPFALSQTAEGEISNGGGHTSLNYGLTRPEGDQYLSEIKTTLPKGLVGEIPDVTLCEEAAANAGTCPASSKIGTVTASSGSGSSPYVFTGTAYMTGPYNGAPFGLSIVVPAIAGPFNLGNVVSRATVNINPITAQVTTVAKLPTIVGGIPIRLRSLQVNVNRQGFLVNPTNCTTPLQVESELTSTEGAKQTGLNTAFPLSNCSKLSFAPKFTAGTSAKTSRANGASLTTTLTPGSSQANIASVKVQLPRQLPSRLSTLNKACTEAQFNTNPLGCPKESKVGTATVVTPTLGKPMTGPAIFVSHGGEAFPDLDLVVEGEGVRVILVGNTNIKNNITTTTFASTPDVPVTSVTVSLPTGPFSALAAYGDICRNPLVMPTTIVSQSGKTVKQNTIISVSGCGVKVVGHKVIGNTAYLTVRTFAAGRITGSGSGVVTTRRSLSAASKAVTLKVPLSSGGRARRKPAKIKIRVGFTPKKGAKSSTTVTVTFR